MSSRNKELFTEDERNNIKRKNQYFYSRNNVTSSYIVRNDNHVKHKTNSLETDGGSRVSRIECLREKFQKL